MWNAESIHADFIAHRFDNVLQWEHLTATADCIVCPETVEEVEVGQND